MDILQIVDKVGEFTSSITSKLSEWISTAINIPVTDFQSKLITLIILFFIFYLFLSVLTIGKKLLKWGLIVISLTLFLSVLVSIFI